MSRYLVKIIETSQKYVHVEARDSKDAYNQAQQRWNNSDPQFVLTYNDFVSADFYVYDSEMNEFF